MHRGSMEIGFFATIVTNLAICLVNLSSLIRVQTTLLALIFQPIPFSARALKKPFDVDIVVKNKSNVL